ncbi:MAG: hypothetical protein ACYST6_08565 [Planctomycetota bacterium]|jgi:hypothetical protein
MPEPFSGESPFRPLLKGTWDFLCDGHATGWVDMPGTLWTPEFPPKAHASGYLGSASIIIEAEVMSGDFDGTRCVDLHDFAVLGLAWQSTPIDENWNRACDISDPNDNIINEQDLSVFVRNWLTCCQ